MKAAVIRMSEPRKISAHQLMVMTVLFNIGSAILVIPSNMASIAKQDAWIASLLGMVVGLGAVWIITSVGILFPQRNLIQITENLLGKWLGKIICLWLVITLFLSGPTVVLFLLGNFLVAQMMPETPIEAIHILFALVVVIGVRLGLATIARAAELLLPFFILLYLLLVGLIIPEIRMSNLQPILETKIESVVSATVSFVSTVNLPLIIMLLIFPAVSNPYQARRAVLAGSLIANLSMAIIIFLTISVFGPESTAIHLFPSYELARKIQIGGFIQRFEAILAFIWIISLFFRLALYFEFTTAATAQILNLKDSKPLILPLGMVMVVMSTFIYPSGVDEQTWSSTTWVSYTLSIGFLLPLLLLFLYGLKKMIKRKSHRSESKG